MQWLLNAILYIFRDNLEQEIQDWMCLSVEQAAESECPLMFISFPSAKDPSWEEKYPGMYDSTRTRVTGLVWPECRASSQVGVSPDVYIKYPNWGEKYPGMYDSTIKRVTGLVWPEYRASSQVRVSPDVYIKYPNWGGEISWYV